MESMMCAAMDAHGRSPRRSSYRGFNEHTGTRTLKSPCKLDPPHSKRIGDCTPVPQLKRARSLDSEVVSSYSKGNSNASSSPPQQRVASAEWEVPELVPQAAGCSTDQHHDLAALHAHLALACDTYSRSAPLTLLLSNRCPIVDGPWSPSPVCRTASNLPNYAGDLDRPALERGSGSMQCSRSDLLMPPPATEDGTVALSPRVPTGAEIHAASSLLFYLPIC